MALNPEMRASDADRDKAAAALREHCAQGRVTVEELNDRLESVYSARTLGDLQRVTADLPEEDLYELPVPSWRSSTPARGVSGGTVQWTRMRAGWATYGSVNLVCFVIWLITAVSSGVWYPWWLWVAGPWGAVMLGGQIFDRSRRDRR
jgi:uncharacterized protein DUF1707